MLETLVGPEMVRAVSLLILVLLLVQLLLSVYGRLRRSLHERRVADLQLAHWRERVEAAADAVRSVETRSGGWQGYRKFEVARVVEETPETRSFYLRPHDGRPLPPFLPGQHLTFQLRIPDQPRPVIRCYSLSAAPNTEQFRITVKKVRYENELGETRLGCSSGFLHGQVHAGDILDVKAPAGEFHLPPGSDHPVVLLAGGVGITPFASIVDALAREGGHREVWLFYSATHRQGAALCGELRAAAEALPQLNLRLLHSRPGEDEQQGVDYHHLGRLDRAYLARELPSNNYDFYLCGPPAMMTSLTEQLIDWGVPAERIHSEAFGPALQPAAVNETVTVHFARSGKALQWSGGSLLELAEKNGVTMESGCRAGSCGACLTAVKSGEVEYLQAPGIVPEAGSCLACVSVPKGALELDA